MKEAYSVACKEVHVGEYALLPVVTRNIWTKAHNQAHEIVCKAAVEVYEIVWLRKQPAS